MKRFKTNTLLTLALSFTMVIATSCNDGEDSTTETTLTDSATATTSSNEIAMATLTGTVPDTTVEGTIKFEAMDGGRAKMILDLLIPKKANQSVAVHLHEMADCGEMGKEAMGHWNPTNAQHGKWGEGSFHSGDIGNIPLDRDGKGHLELESDRWSLGGDSSTSIINRSVIIHSGIDDYTSQPSGNSGSRIGCGIISRGM